MILTQSILFIHKPDKSRLSSDIIKHSLGIFVMQDIAHIFTFFLGVSFIKLAYAFMIQEVLLQK